MHARTGTIQVSPDTIDEAVRRLEEDQLPRYREMQGYKGFTAMADRQSGKVIGISFWESEADREASEQLGAEAREQIASTGGSGSEPVAERFEVLLDDMA